MYLFDYLINAYFTLLSGTAGFNAALLLVPLVVNTLAAIFVYRHTARRRKLQLTLTVLASLILTSITLVLVARIIYTYPYSGAPG